MTFEEKLKALLVEHGMFERQAQVIVDRMKAHEWNAEVRWNDQVEHNPLSMLAILWSRAQKEALAYIDEVCPKAFNRSMFV